MYTHQSSSGPVFGYVVEDMSSSTFGSTIGGSASVEEEGSFSIELDNADVYDNVDGCEEVGWVDDETPSSGSGSSASTGRMYHVLVTCLSSSSCPSLEYGDSGMMM